MTSILPMNFCVYPTLQYSDISWFTAPMSSNTLWKKSLMTQNYPFGPGKSKVKLSASEERNSNKVESLIKRWAAKTCSIEMQEKNQGYSQVPGKSYRQGWRMVFSLRRRTWEKLGDRHTDKKYFSFRYAKFENLRII